MRRSVFLACLCLLGHACAGDDARTATYAVRDSAGVEIVDSNRPLWLDGDLWTIDPEPALDLSGQEDDELFRMGSARVLTDGRIVLFNGGRCEIRIYSDTGEFIGSSGRCGEGPGEFGASARIWPWAGDSLLVDSARRITILSDSGSFGRITPIPASDRMPIPGIRGVVGDHTLVLAGLESPAGRTTPGIEVATVSLGLTHHPDGPPQLVGSYPGTVYEYTEFQGRLGRGSLAFSASTQFAIGSEHVFAGHTADYEIQVLSPGGTLERIIRRHFQRVHVEPRDIDHLMNRRLAEVEGVEDQRLVRQAFRDLEHAEVMPAFGVPVWPGGAEGGPAMLVDDVGNLWVFRHYRPGEYRNEWTVFSADGIWLGAVTLPEHLMPTHIGDDYIMGQWTDSLGFAHVRRHQLVKP